MKRMGSARALVGDSNQMIRRAIASVSVVMAIGFIGVNVEGE
jgi:hypothetical protein